MTQKITYGEMLIRRRRMGYLSSALRLVGFWV